MKYKFKKNIVIITTISIMVNLFCIIGGVYVIHRKGGVEWISNKINSYLNRNNDTESYSEYYLIKKDIFESQSINENAIVFLGDSLTDNYDWAEKFNDSNIQNRGIGGDTTAGVLNRLETTLLQQPKKIFLMIGTNDLGEGKTIEYIVNNYKKIIETIKTKSPNTVVYLQSVLPGNKSLSGSGISSNKDIIELNKNLESMIDEKVKYINIYDSMLDGNGDLNKEYTYDGTHLNYKGYNIWCDIIESYVKK